MGPHALSWLVTVDTSCIAWQRSTAASYFPPASSYGARAIRCSRLCRLLGGPSARPNGRQALLSRSGRSAGAGHPRVRREESQLVAEALNSAPKQRAQGSSQERQGNHLGSDGCARRTKRWRLVLSCLRLGSRALHKPMGVPRSPCHARCICRARAVSAVIDHACHHRCLAADAHGAIASCGPGCIPLSAR